MITWVPPPVIYQTTPVPPLTTLVPVSKMFPLLCALVTSNHFVLQTETIAVCSRSWAQVAQTTGFWILLGFSGYQGLQLAREWWGRYRRRRWYARMARDHEARDGILTDDDGGDGPSGGGDPKGGGGPEGAKTVRAEPPKTSTTGPASGSQTPRSASAREEDGRSSGTRPKAEPRSPPARPLKSEILQAQRALDESKMILSRVAGAQAR